MDPTAAQARLIEVLLGHHAGGQKVPTVVPRDRDKVSLPLEGKSLGNLESALVDHVRDLELAPVLVPDVASAEAITPFFDVRLA